MGSKGQYKTHCDKCGTERKLLNNGRYICPECQRQAAKESYHKNKKPLTDIQKESKKISNLKWKYTVRESGFTNQQISMISNRYKLSEEELLSLINKQDCKCAICSKELNKNISNSENKDADLCIDHCHVTNKVRGLLCRDCNFALGLFKDNADNLTNAIKYLNNVGKNN